MIALSLPSGSQHGWGVAGDNIRRELSKIVEIADVQTLGYPVELDCPVFHAIQGHNFLPLDMNVWSKTRNVGYCFIEEASKAARFVPNANRYFDYICSGSTWGAKKLREIGLKNVGVVLQGIDPEIFHPSKNVHPPKDKFVIFSGGKAEFRKGQDFVLAAVKRFMNNHADAHLVAAWYNPWPQTMQSLAQSTYIRFPNVTGDWENIVRAMLLVNEFPLDRVTILPATPNSSMADIYRGCHVGLWPNRCEAGTNLPLMESIACGLPAIATSETGHSDLTKFFFWEIKSTVYGSDGWCEPDVESALLMLNSAYDMRPQLADAGRYFSKLLSQNMTWDLAAQGVLDCSLGQLGYK